MKDVVLDTNFILTCVKQKIDFFEEIKLMGISIIIPKPIIKELEKISQKDDKMHFRDDAKLALMLLEKNNFRKIGLDGKNVDSGIIKMARANKYLIIATLDKRIKNSIHNPKLVIREKKKLEID
jgi:rRNA-processing protein FCF1